MIPLNEALESTLKRLGLKEPTAMLDVSREWDAFAGESWSGVTRPLYLRDGVLIVEVLNPPAMGFLRYGVSELERRLAERFGSEVVRAVELRAAPRPPSRRP